MWIKITNKAIGNLNHLTIKDVFYTFEFGAEVVIDPKDDIEAVKEKLWNDCHSEVDKQISDVVSPKKND